MIRAFLEQLFQDPAVTRVQTDASPANRRAIRCYEKAGFKAIGQVSTPDGPALLICGVTGQTMSLELDSAWPTG
jgi:RimJ/RimL family protein N-acetyltransferase